MSARSGGIDLPGETRKRDLSGPEMRLGWSGLLNQPVLVVHSEIDFWRKGNCNPLFQELHWFRSRRFAI